jgi:hypothetical protein
MLKGGQLPATCAYQVPLPARSADHHSRLRSPGAVEFARSTAPALHPAMLSTGDT